MKTFQNIVLFSAFIISLSWSTYIFILLNEIWTSINQNPLYLIFTVLSLFYLLGVLGFISIFQKTHLHRPRLSILLVSTGASAVFVFVILILMYIISLAHIFKQWTMLILLICPANIKIYWVLRIKKQTITQV